MHAFKPDLHRSFRYINNDEDVHSDGQKVGSQFSGGRSVLGSVESVDVVLEGEIWATVVGAYAFMPNSKNGLEALDGILCEVIDVIASGRERVIVAGDFNLWPNDLNRFMNDLPLIDAIGTIEGIPELEDGKGGSRIWTHKNGNSPNAARQEIDYIYVSEALADEFVSGGGGIDDYPSSWEFSDHAPVMTQFNVN